MEGMREDRRHYSEEFKQGAVDLVLGGQSMAAVGRQLDIPETTLQRWVAPARNGGREQGHLPEPGHPVEAATYQAAVRRIRELEQEVEFLGKASAYFAQKRHP